MDTFVFIVLPVVAALFLSLGLACYSASIFLKRRTEFRRVSTRYDRVIETIEWVDAAHYLLGQVLITTRQYGGVPTDQQKREMQSLYNKKPKGIT